MNTLLDVRELGPASVTKAKWFLNMIGDAGAACRFQKGLPGVDISPLNGINGPFAGMVVPNITRWSVNLSIKSIFWRQGAIIEIYLHECTHLLILEQCRLKNSWTHAHGPIFLLIQLVLYHRVDVLKKYEFKLVPRVNLYDFSDRPFDSNDSMPEWEWRSIVLGFALKNYRELAESELTAEGVAEEAFNLWGVHVQGLVADKEAKTEKAIELGRKAEVWERLAKERDGLQAQIKELERQRDVSFGWRFLFRIGWSGLILPGFLALALYTSFVAAIAFATAWHRLL